jgi:hypothetical protein
MQLGKVVENNFGDVFFSDINGNSFAQQSAHTLFEKYIFPHLETEDRVYLIVGTDSGLLANAIEQRFSNNLGKRQFIFIEHPDVLACFSQLHFPSWLRIVSGDKDIVDFISENYLEAVAEDKLILVQSIALIDGHIDYIAMKKTLLEALTAYKYERGSMINSDIYNNAILHNLAHNVMPLQQFEQALQGMQAVVVGAGPSLDSSIEWIRNNQKNLVVFAVARVAKRLSDAGIKVNFFVSIDPSLDSFFNSRDMLKTDYPCILINDSHVNPNLLSQWRWQHLYFDVLYPWLPRNNKSIMSLGNTVTHFAVGAAVLLGAKDIYLAGVDMCYKGNQTHAVGSSENQLGKYYISERPQVKTYRGEWSDTTIIFDQGREALARQVAFCRQNMGNGVQFYNLSADAALVDGIVLWDKKQNIVNHVIDIEDNYQTLLKLATPTLAQERKHIVNAIKTLQAKRLLFSQAQRLAQEGLKLAQSIDDGYFLSQDKLHKIERKLVQSVAKDQRFFSLMGFLFFERLVLLENYFKENNKSLQSLSGQDFNIYYSTKFNAFLKTSIKITAMIDDALIRLQSYKQFLDGTRPLDDLAKSWLSYGEPGMIYYWEMLFPEQAALEKNQVTMSELKNAYQFLLEEAQGNQMEKLRAQAFDIPYLLNELSRALQLSDQTELQNLEQAFVNAVETNDDKAGVVSLFNALRLNVRGDPESALLCFSTLQFDHKLLQKFMLTEKLKLALSLNQHDAIVATYESLSVLSPEFLPAFANYWLMMNQPQQALPLLQAYLQQQPEDLEAQLRLLRVWLALSDIEQASILLKRLKNNHPHNNELTQIELSLMKLGVTI